MASLNLDNEDETEGEDAFGGEAETSSAEDLFASFREALKSGNDKAGVSAFKELMATCKGEMGGKGKGLALIIGGGKGSEEEGDE